MAAVTAERPGRRIHPGIAIAAFVVALLVLGTVWKMTFSPRPIPQTPQEKQNSDWLQAVSVKAGGDWSKLSQEDQAKARKLVGNMAPMAVKMSFQHPH